MFNDLFSEENHKPIDFLDSPDVGVKDPQKFSIAEAKQEFLSGSGVNQAEDEKSHIDPREIREAQAKMEDVLYGLFYSDIISGRVAESFDFVAENPARLNEAARYASAIENIINRASNLTGLNNTERENISKMQRALKRCEGELSDRGAEISHTNNTQEELDDPEISGEPIDMNTAYEYGYHATSLRNTPGIAEKGLVGSNGNSKERGTIWFASYNDRYNPAVGMMLRTKIKNMPDYFQYGEEAFGGPGLSTGHAVTTRSIPLSELEYSLDNGGTWRHDLRPFVNSDVSDNIKSPDSG